MKSTKQEVKKQKSEQQIRTFLQRYQIKKMTFQQILNVYYKSIALPQFRNSAFSAFIMIFAPSITNIYYTFRPNASLSKIMPFAVPVICVIQYASAVKYDLENFCFKETDDAQTIRKKYAILSELEITDTFLKKMGEDIKDIKNQIK